MNKLKTSQHQRAKKTRYPESAFSNFPEYIDRQSTQKQNTFLSQVNSRLKDTSLRGKAVVLSLAICSLPAAGITALSYHLGNRIISAEVVNDTEINPVKQLEATQKQLLLMLQIGTMAAALLAGISAATIARRLILPIYAANLAVKKIASGNLNTRIPIKGKDEFALLSNNINLILEQFEELLFQQRVETEQSQLVSDAIISICQSLNSKDLFKRTVTEVRQILGAHRVVIYHCNSNGEGQVIAEDIAPGLPITFGETIEDISIAKELTEFYTKAKVFAINDVDEAGLKAENLKLMERLKIKAILLTPIFKDNKIFGFLIAHHCWKAHLWQAFEINFLKQLAIQVGSTLEQVSTLETTQAIQNLTIKLSESVTHQDICNAAVENIRKNLKVEKTLICKLESQTGTFIAESAVSDLPSALGKKFDFPVSGLDNAIAINNIQRAGLQESAIKQLEALNIKATLLAPIFQNEQLFGYLIACQSQNHLWQQSEIQLFEQSAVILGKALQRADGISEAQQSPEIFQLVESLREIVTQVKLTATEVNSAIANDRNAMDLLTTNANKQTVQIDQTLEAVGDMRSSIKAIAKGASKTASVANKAFQTAQEGGVTMDLTVKNIHSLRETIGDTAKKLKLLGESSQKISHVVSSIDRIAMQTNLLAVNAGIEATRAGEQGEGFAIIAEEIAALATRSGNATEEIEEIVADIQRETNEVGTAMELGITQVVDETRLIEDSKQNFDRILDVSHQMDGLVESISAATVIQVKTSKQVTDLIKEIAEISQNTGNSSQEISLSLQKTIDISKKLAATVDAFKVN